MRSPVLPGKTIGLVGGGQLGRMFTLAAHTMGYRVQVLTPNADDPTAQVADRAILADYGDREALMALASSSDVVTYEFEGVDAEGLRSVKEIVPVFPDPEVLFVVQNRIREKSFLEQHGFPVARFRCCANYEDLVRAVKEIGVAAVVKSASDGYDGKGQIKICSLEDLPEAWETLGKRPCVVEEWVELDVELSVVVARDRFKGTAVYGPFENVHRNHILDLSVFPAHVPREIADAAQALALRFVEQIQIIGVVCVEFFLCRNRGLLINEIAPRPHNSGHLTIEAFSSSQFLQQVRTVCGMRVAETNAHGSAAMVNIMGEEWEFGEPNWAAVLGKGNVHLHLYGKAHACSGRKMGHITCLARSPGKAKSDALAARELLRPIS